MWNQACTNLFKIDVRVWIKDTLNPFNFKQRTKVFPHTKTCANIYSFKIHLCGKQVSVYQSATSIFDLI